MRVVVQQVLAAQLLPIGDISVARRFKSARLKNGVGSKIV